MLVSSAKMVKKVPIAIKNIKYVQASILQWDHTKYEFDT